MSAEPKKYFTPEEYLELERKAPYKSEYFNGVIYPMGDYEGDTPIAMAGARPRHNAIRENLSIELGTFLRRKSCRTFSSDQRVFIPETSLYTYPDLLVVCGRPEFSDVERDAVTNPVLLVEVLSKSTANYDRGEKFELYRSIPSFQEYLLVDSRRTRVELWQRNEEGKWTLAFEGGDLAQSIHLQSIGLTITLEDIYANTDDLPVDEPFEIR
jgi:Uma2 family endonuclease